MDNFTRLAFPNIEAWLKKHKAIVLIGARQVGKTTLVNKLIKSTKQKAIYLNADEANVRESLGNATLNQLKDTIGNHKLIVIDEVQRIDNAGLLLKRITDNFKDVQLIATGSSALEIADKVFEPLTGRHVLMHLYPFSVYELYKDESKLTIENNLPFHLIHGFYPEICTHRADAEALLKNLASQYLYKDVLVWKDIRKPELLDKLLQLLAYQMGSEVSLNELANQLKVKTETIDSYIDLLEKAFVVFRLSSYATNQRKEVSKMKKIYFWDNGIRNAIINDFRPIQVRQDAGALFENMMVADRLKMNEWKNKNVKPYFWRTLQQQEVDYVEKSAGQLDAFEFKYSETSKVKLTKAFTNAYPDARGKIITPKEIKDFCW
ncbi:MAG: ATP-binding protein [Bacteroidetes bacterium]|nr:ATP-binding protein [Bacteroidota bacterium]